MAPDEKTGGSDPSNLVRATKLIRLELEEIVKTVSNLRSMVPKQVSTEATQYIMSAYRQIEEARMSLLNVLHTVDEKK